VDFAYTAEQELLRDTARRYLADRYPTDTLAALADGPVGFDPGAWPVLTRQGWLDAELTGVELGILAERSGYALLPAPWWSTVALARPAAGADLAGPATLAWVDEDHPGDGLAGAAWHSTTRAEPAGGGWRLHGVKTSVPDAAAATAIVVTAAGPTGVGLYLVDPAAAEITELSTLDGLRRSYRVALAGAPATELVAAEHTPHTLTAVRRRALALLAGEAVGVAQRAFDTAVDYAKVRTQFDRPIGGYQAVAHRIADSYAELELARSLAYRAAWALDGGAATDANAADANAADANAADVAAVAARRAAVRAAEDAIQVTGGIGVTWEYPLHRWYRRALWLAAFDGGAGVELADLAARILDEPPVTAQPAPAGAASVHSGQ
jgi:acyl-CoA dehydrogenase